MAKSNAEQVAKIVRIARELGIEPATPDEARQILGLKAWITLTFESGYPFLVHSGYRAF